MRVSKDGRTTTDRKYRPFRREVSRYGKLEKVLREMEAEGCTTIKPNSVACRVRILTSQQVTRMLAFTIGVDKGSDDGTYIFTGDEIRVDNSKGVVP